jgi:hypothetical protein
MNRARCALTPLLLCFGFLGATVGLADSGTWQLFVDNHVITTMRSVRRTYHAFEKYAANPVMRATKPYEGSIVYLYGTVLPKEDGDGYRMWYQSFTDAEGYRVCYATSRDGLRWEKPDLGLVTAGGSTANNILFVRTREDHNPQVIATPWASDPLQRYRMLTYDYGHTPPGHTVRGYWGASSGDGVHWAWQEQPMNPVLPHEGDVGNFTWDPLHRRFLGWQTEAADFTRWQKPRPVLFPDPFDDRWAAQPGQHTDFYGMSAFPYQNMYIGFLWVFRVTSEWHAGLQLRWDGPVHVELVTSRDGVNWDREEAPRPPILPTGAAGTWDQGMVFTCNQPVVEDGLIKLWYGGFSSTHDAKGVQNVAAVGYATLRKDGFASLDAGEEEGEVTTRPIVGANGNLLVNCRATGGELRAEVLDEAGRVLPGYERANSSTLVGDELSQAITWGSREHLPSWAREGVRSIRLRFILTRASLYSFHAGDDAQVNPD